MLFILTRHLTVEGVRLRGGSGDLDQGRNGASQAAPGPGQSLGPPPPGPESDTLRFVVPYTGDTLTIWGRGQGSGGVVSVS